MNTDITKLPSLGEEKCGRIEMSSHSVRISIPPHYKGLVEIVKRLTNGILKLKIDVYAIENHTAQLLGVQVF
jgi:hypothetical protein